MIGSDEEAATELAALGPFFVVDRHAAGDAPTGAWQPVTDLTDPAALGSRVTRVRAALAGAGGLAPADIDERVGVSVAQLGLVARLIAPSVGAAALGLRFPASADRLWWQDELGGPFPLSAAAGGDVLAVPGSAVEAITLACQRAFAVSPRVLWGNVASAANGAAVMIGRARPDLAERARAAADLVLSDERVDGGTLRAGTGFRRRSCCLIYRLAGTTAAVCADCVLARVRDRHPGRP